MKTYKIALRNLSIFTIMLMALIACDQDFASIESDIINQDNATNFNTNSESYEVISYTDALGPVQTNNLPINMLGVYNDPNYGKTTASIVTQVSSSLTDPTFGGNVVLDSVVLTLPYFITNVGLTEDNQINYRLDSIFPKNASNDYKSIKLSVFENNYLLRNFDPNGDFDTPQAYFSNKSLTNSEIISNSDLELVNIHTEEELIISSSQINLLDEDGEISEIQAPSIRLLLDTTYWKEKILDQEGTPVLSNASNFSNYFRGLYFKAEEFNGDGSLIGLNLTASNANVTLYYTADSASDATVRNQSTYTLSFGPNRVNFFENNFTTPISDGDSENGDSRLFLKGGEGAIAGIKLFNDPDVNSPNNFENFRNTFAVIENDEYQSSKRLINEANLVFYVDQNLVNGEEPNRIYLYDMDNNTPLIDFFIDATSNTLPAFSKGNHLGILQREGDESDGEGIKYKLKITEHIKNLILNDSTNVSLGIAVSGNINVEETQLQRIEQTTEMTEKRLPTSSIISPRGTVIHGSNSEDESKKLYLEIFYTCIENNDCE